MLSKEHLQRLGWSQRAIAAYAPLTRLGLAAAVVVLIAAQLVAHSRLVATTIADRYMQDFGVFYGATQRVLDGHRDPYSEIVSPGQATSTNPVNLNPPHFVMLMLPLGALRPDAALILFGILSVCAAVWALRTIVGELELQPTTGLMAWMALATVYAAPTTALLLTGQVAWLLWWPVTWAWAAARHGQWIPSAIVLGIVASLKPFVGLFVPFLALAVGRGAAIAAAASAFVCLSVGAIGLGWTAFASWLDALRSVTWALHILNASLLGVLKRLFTERLMPEWNVEPLTVAPSVVWPLWGAGSVVILAVSSWAVLRDQSHASADRFFVVVLSAALLVSPLGWIYYEFLLVGPVLALATVERWWDGSGWRRLLLGCAVVSVLLGPGALASFQPSGWSTVSLGSTYFWGLLSVWICAVAGSFASARRASNRSGSGVQESQDVLKGDSGVLRRLQLCQAGPVRLRGGKWFDVRPPVVPSDD
jgi:hypothetical protein